MQALMCEPYWTARKQAVMRYAGTYLTQLNAKALYRIVTRLDPYDGAWEPDDTGSDGLSAAKGLMTVVRGKRYINGYTHIFGEDHLRAAIQYGPCIVGTNWYDSMFDTDQAGNVSISGQVAGGHEWTVLGYNADRDAYAALQSWGEWGVPIPEAHVTTGGFWVPSEVMRRLLSEGGDATQFTV
jgi:hypothetical protein